MKRITILTVLTLATASSLAWADGPTAKPSAHDHAKHAPSSAPAITVPAAAKQAVAAVDRFSSALAAGRLEAAGAELDPNVVILESGGAERSAAEYLGGHAKGDAAFLKGVHVQLTRRSAHVNGDLVWVASESEMHFNKDGKPVTVLSTETMLVQRTGANWKIVHIHWSSRTKNPAAAH